MKCEIVSTMCERDCKGKGWWRTNNLLRKSPTSAVVEGPPILRKTMAVPWCFAVTGYTGVGVSSHLVCCLRKVVEGRTDRAAAGNRKAMVMTLAAPMIMRYKN